MEQISLGASDKQRRYERSRWTWHSVLAGRKPWRSHAQTCAQTIRGILVLALMLTVAGLSPTPAYATTGPYTMPFFDASIGVTQY
jgi:hypothetical protein